MEGKTRKLSIARGLGESAAVGFFLGMTDGTLLLFLSIFSFEEVFLLRSGPLNISLSGNMLLLLIVSCAAAGVFNTVLLKTAGRLLPARIKPTAADLSVIELAILLMLLRVWTLDNATQKIQYSGALLAVILVFSLLRRLIRKWTPRRFFSQPWIGRSVAVILIFLLALILAFPSLLGSYLQSRLPKVGVQTDRPNILLIVMDTVRADSLSCYNPEIKNTPNIQKIAGEGCLYQKAISPSPWTLPSHASIFTGLYPSQHGAVWDNRFLDGVFLTMAEYLSGIDYQTVGFVENPFVGRNMGLAQGFREYYEMYTYPRRAVLPRLIDRTRAKLSDFRETREYTRDSISGFKTWLVRKQRPGNSRPFFAFLNLMSAHLPNYPRPRFTSIRPSSHELRRIEPVNLIPERFYLPQHRLSDDQLEIMRLLYDSDVSYLDTGLGKLFDFLRKTGILDNTILILTSDHGENFGDHRLIEHQFCLYNSLLHVPLIIRYPRAIRPGSKSEDLVSTIFLFQTLIDWTGAPEQREFQPIEKRSLAKPNSDQRVYAEHENFIRMIKNILQVEAPPDFNFQPFDKSWKCIYDSEFKLIRSSDGNSELYRLSEDWGEKNNLIGLRGEMAELLLQTLESWQESLWRMPLEKRVRKVDKTTEEALKSLGYIR
jgi:arylsulfatase A-like enzyme